MSKKSNYIPQRMCLGCRESKPQNDLIRLSVSDGRIAISKGKEFGRGAYLCGSSQCLELALKKKAFQRLLKRSILEEEVILLSEAIK